MPKGKSDTEKISSGRPINFRAPDDLAKRLDSVGEALGLDISNLVRMILYENIAPYEERAAVLRTKGRAGKPTS